ncbi:MULTISPECIES: ATP-binding protein [Streptomyces]|uniref:Histidine kinase/HSP90-like ATPase domain-containing protein n=1 Tax=Streptomyces zinciresistens K42 TaxID=700597 RepID=G2G768_9ACTN|nr:MULTISPECIES: ATP-binding protein [Streptomyces]EGX60609.1 hypothetical protein SZN_06651 [Streptomyces zinciresistens K42]MDT9695913.1 ATP-binding protein [Streptomyces sp. P17]
MSALLETPQAGGPARAMSRGSRRQYEATFDVVAEDLATVRSIVRGHLRWWRAGEDTVDRVLFAVNELLTNVLEHTAPDDSGRRQADILVQRVPGGVTAVVRDSDPSPLERRNARPLDESGRGLALVRALVDESSVSKTDAGKDVWFFVADQESEGRTEEP